MKKCCIVAYAAKQKASESDADFKTRCIALEYIRYGKVVLLPDEFDYNTIKWELADAFIAENPDFNAVEFELQVADA